MRLGVVRHQIDRSIEWCADGGPLLRRRGLRRGEPFAARPADRRPRCMPLRCRGAEPRCSVPVQPRPRPAPSRRGACLRASRWLDDLGSAPRKVLPTLRSNVQGGLRSTSRTGAPGARRLVQPFHYLAVAGSRFPAARLAKHRVRQTRRHFGKSAQRFPSRSFGDGNVSVVRLVDLRNC